MSNCRGEKASDIVSFLKANEAAPKEDMAELWKRIVFSMAISNTDDHLRNHGFILQKKGWCLSPLYDVNPCEYGETLALNVNEYSNEISLDLAIEASVYYGLTKRQAEQLAAECIETVKNNWEKIAAKNGLSRGAVEYMRPEFSLCK